MMTMMMVGVFKRRNNKGYMAPITSRKSDASSDMRVVYDIKTDVLKVRQNLLDVHRCSISQYVREWSIREEAPLHHPQMVADAILAQHMSHTQWSAAVAAHRRLRASQMVTVGGVTVSDAEPCKRRLLRSATPTA